MLEHMPVGLIVISIHRFMACLHVNVPRFGPCERRFTAEGPEEGAGVEMWTPVGCWVGDADGFVETSR